MNGERPAHSEIEPSELLTGAADGAPTEEGGAELSQTTVDQTEDKAPGVGDSVVTELADRLNGTKIPPVDSAAILFYIGETLKRRGLVDSSGRYVGEVQTTR